jgi:polyadenylate-binding protein
MSNNEDDSVQKVQLLQKQKPPVTIHRKNNTNAKQKSSEKVHSPTSDDVPLDECNIFVKYLPQDVDDSTLRELFTKFGTIVSCKVMLDNRNNNGASLGFGYHLFDH